MWMLTISTHRRCNLKCCSLFWSPGTTSSPNLATLVHKQWERNTPLPSLPTTMSVADAWGTVNAWQRTIWQETGKGGLAPPCTSIPSYIFTHFTQPPTSMCVKTSNFFTKVFGGNGSMWEKGVCPSSSCLSFFWCLDMCSWNPPPPVQASHTTIITTWHTWNIRHPPHHWSLCFWTSDRCVVYSVPSSYFSLPFTGLDLLSHVSPASCLRTDWLYSTAQLVSIGHSTC